MAYEKVHSVKTTPLLDFSFMPYPPPTSVWRKVFLKSLRIQSIGTCGTLKKGRLLRRLPLQIRTSKIGSKNLTNEWGDLDLITLAEGEKREVIVEIIDKDSNPKIMIIDNGVGMNCEELNIALTPSEKLSRQRMRTRKGMYNMGLKAGWAGLGHVIDVKTKSIKEGNSFYTTVDSRNFAELTEWDIDIVERDDIPTELEEKNFEHGTVIIISELYNKNQDWESGRWGVTRNFSGELANVEITWEGDPCIYEDPDMTEMIVTLDDKNLFVKNDLGNGNRGEEIQITGWIGLVKNQNKELVVITDSIRLDMGN